MINLIDFQLKHGSRKPFVPTKTGAANCSTMNRNKGSIRLLDDRWLSNL